MTSGGKLEVATHKLGSIHIEDKLKEETPWWAKLKKKHGGKNLGPFSSWLMI